MKFKLYFARSFEAAMQLEQSVAVVVWPREDASGNAEGRLEAGMCVKMYQQSVIFKSPVAFFSERFTDCKSAIEAVLLGRDLVEVESGFISVSGAGEKDKGAPSWFATLQGNIESYRHLVRSIGSHATKLALKSAHDVLLYDPGSNVSGGGKSVEKSDVFRNVVLRSHERYFAYRRGADVLDGAELRSLQRSSAKALVSFKLSGFRSRHEISLNFENSGLFDRRINVLIGENGVGKSQTLVNIVHGLARSKIDSLVQSNDHFSRVIAFSSSPGRSSLPGKLRSQHILLYRHFALSPSWVRSGDKGALTAALVDLVRDDTRIGGRSRFQIFDRALKKWLPLARIGLPIKKSHATPRHYVTRGGDVYLPLSLLLGASSSVMDSFLDGLDSDRGPEFFSEGDILDSRYSHASRPNDSARGALRELQPLSSGQQLFFKFSLNLCAFIESGALVLVDEPENHLHPAFITQLMSLLREVLRETGSFAVVATHSPFVVREVTGADVSILSRTNDGEPLVRSPRLQTLGASVAAVSAYVFGDETVVTLARLTEDAFQRLKGRNVDPNSEHELAMLSKEMSTEAVAYIRASLLRNSLGGDQ